MRRSGQGDLFDGRRPIRRTAADTPKADWKGPGTEPHDYHPDTMAMGDCSVCGHTYDAHLASGEVEGLAPPSP